MHLSVKVLFEQTPRQLGYTWVHSEPVRFIDAMNITRDFPLDLCSAPNDFVDLVRFLFRKRRGRSYVERGQYALTVGDKELQWANKELWRQPRDSAVLRALIDASSCDAVFRVSQSGEVINSFAPFAGDRHPQRENYDDSDDAKYFRRFYVVFENPITQGPFCITPVTNPPDGFHLEGTDFERRFESV
ncbi:hypothetical protein C0989_002967 [Termitomyces sp. Mn162]|nr:hypothetical protein C0989_002967 [Termitomyces sp. Mn162]